MLVTRAMRAVLGDGLITSDGERWKSDRRRMNPMFRREALGDVEASAIADARDASRRWGERPFRLDDALAALVLRTVTRTVLGIDISDATEGIGAALRVLVEQSAERSLHSALPAWIPTARNRAYVAARKTLDAIVAQFVAQGRASGRSSLLAAMLDADGAPFDARALHDHLLTFLLAGHETTALALLFALLALDAHPEALAWLRAEDIDAPERRARLVAVLREAMRLMPPVWMLGRRVVGDDVIDGTRIPRGSIVLVSPYLVHRQADVFPDPERFDPARFHGRSPPPGSYLPFGFGPRHCIGAAFAERIATAMLSVLTIENDVRIDAQPTGWTPLVTLRPASPVIATVGPTALRVRNDASPSFATAQCPVSSVRR